MALAYMFGSYNTSSSFVMLRIICIIRTNYANNYKKIDKKQPPESQSTQ